MTRRDAGGERRRAVIVGVGQTDFAALHADRGPHDAYGLAAHALREALKDAGLGPADVDGLITSWVAHDRAAAVLGIRNPRVVLELPGIGRMSGVAVQQAAILVEAGAADTIALVYGNNGRSRSVNYGAAPVTPSGAYSGMFGMSSGGAELAVMWRRYQHLYGAPDGSLAPIAISNRRHASLNPAAVMRREITEQEYLASRYIAEPLRLLDYCIINDGGVALVVTTLERARTLRKRPVLVAAMASCGDLGAHYVSPDFFYSACQIAADKLWSSSGIRHDDVDCLQIYDNMTPTVLFSLEGFGFTPQGESWEWIRDGRIGLGGSCPINTAGGHTGESYMQGWSHHVEAVRQIRGEAGPRQIEGCAVAQYLGVSPIVTSHLLVGG